jgi:hypothetical protein
MRASSHISCITCTSACMSLILWGPVHHPPTGVWPQRAPFLALGRESQLRDCKKRYISEELSEI